MVFRFDHRVLLRKLGGLLALIPLATTAWADATIGGKTVECYCTDKTGARVELGQVMCLEVDGRRFTAQCQMSLNVPMWRELRNDCVMSQIETTPSQSTSQGSMSIVPALETARS